MLSLYDKQWPLREDYKTHTTPGQVKVPFLSQPPKHYLGAAWYQREIDIPAAAGSRGDIPAAAGSRGDVPKGWRGQRVVLHLERPRPGIQAGAVESP